jgi:hypothetical protein
MNCQHACVVIVTARVLKCGENGVTMRIEIGDHCCFLIVYKSMQLLALRLSSHLEENLLCCFIGVDRTGKELNTALRIVIQCPDTNGLKGWTRIPRTDISGFNFSLLSPFCPFLLLADSEVSPTYVFVFLPSYQQ